MMTSALTFCLGVVTALVAFIGWTIWLRTERHAPPTHGTAPLHRQRPATVIDKEIHD